MTWIFCKQTLLWECLLIHPHFQHSTIAIRTIYFKGLLITSINNNLLQKKVCHRSWKYVLICPDVEEYFQLYGLGSKIYGLEK